MKNGNQTMLASALGLLLAGGALYAQPAEGPGRPAERGPRRPPPELMEKYDIDQDGVLSPEERAALREDMQAGKIQPPARGQGAMRDPGNWNRGTDREGAPGRLPPGQGNPERMRRQANRPPGDPMPGPGEPGMGGMPGRPGGMGGPGRPSAKEVLQRFDRDGDGMLNERELNGFLRAAPPMRPQGMGGPPPMGGGQGDFANPDAPRPPRRPLGPPPAGGPPGNRPPFDEPPGLPPQPGE